MKDLRQSLENLSPQQRALLAQRLAQKRAAPPQKVPIRDSSEPAPLSFSQWRLWFLDRLENRNSGYNVYRGARLSGPLDAAALQNSLTEIVRRHSILRTTFPAIRGQPRQVIAPPHEVKLPLIDLTKFPEGEREERVIRLATWESKRLFNLARDPLLRTVLLHLGPEEHVLLLTTHHIAADGWSVGTLFSELAALYDAFSAGKPSPLPELPLQFADFAAWQREWLQGDVLRQHLDYWKQHLDGAPPALELPTDRPREQRSTFSGARHFLQMPRTLLDGLNTLSRQEGVTLFMSLLAAFNVLLGRYSGQDDIVIGSPIAGRTRPELEGLIGCFSNTLVLRNRLSGGQTFRDLLRRVREVALGAFAHQDMPFDKLVEELRPARVPHRTPLFQVNFRLLTAPQPPVQLSGLRVQYLEIDNQMAKFDLAVELCPRPDGLGGYIEYFTDLFDPSTIQRMAADLEALLRGVETRPDAPLSELAAVPAHEHSEGKGGPGMKRQAVALSGEATTEKATPRYKLRKASLKDSAFLYRLRALVLKRYVSQFAGWTEQQKEAYYLDFDPAIHEIIVIDGKDVGDVSIIRSDKEVRFINLHLLPEYQNLGLGTAIFQEAIAEATAKGVPVVLQGVLKTNPAIKLYERLGFEITGESDLRYVMTRPCPAAAPGEPQAPAGPLAVQRKAVTFP